MKKVLTTKEEKKNQKIKETQLWLFNIFNHYDIEYIVEQLDGVGQWFSAGCYLIASGDHKTGRHVCNRAINRLVHLVPMSQTKAKQVMRYVETNCERFARAAGSRNEMNKAFNALDYQDEEID